MSNYTPPPTYAEPILPGPEGPNGTTFIFNPVWLKWFVDLAKLLGDSGISGTTAGGFQHNALGGEQGGNVAASEMYHLNASYYNNILSGVTYPGNLPLAKITPGGTDGYISFTFGIITAYLAPT